MDDQTKAEPASKVVDNEASVLAGFAAARQTQRKQSGSYGVISPFAVDDHEDER